MDTLKTVFVVGLLGVVLYFAYTFLSKEEGSPPPEVADLTENSDELSAPEIDLGPSLSPDSNEYQPVMRAELSNESDGGDSPEVQTPSYQKPDSQGSVGGISGGDTTNDPYGNSDPYGNNDPYGEVDPYAANDPYMEKTGSDNGDDSEYVPSRPAYGENVVVGERPDAGDQTERAIANPYTGDETNSNNYDSNTGQSASEQLSVADWVGEKQTVQQMLVDSKHADALRYLSNVYRTQPLSDAERAEALDILDSLAGMVVYSREHFLEAPYVVQANETLVQIAAKHRVPMPLLRNINGIDDPSTLQAGTQLKVLQGPFAADVNTATSEMTLYVQGMYAGRFGIRVGANPAPAPGEFRVNRKLDGKTFMAADLITTTAGLGSLPKDHAQNPYGRVWIDLGNSMGIHGSHQPLANQMGCISLSPVDAADVYAILSQGSTVIVR